MLRVTLSKAMSARQGSGWFRTICRCLAAKAVEMVSDEPFCCGPYEAVIQRKPMLRNRCVLQRDSCEGRLVSGVFLAGGCRMLEPAELESPHGEKKQGR